MKGSSGSKLLMCCGVVCCILLCCGVLILLCCGVLWCGVVWCGCVAPVGIVECVLPGQLSLHRDCVVPQHLGILALLLHTCGQFPDRKRHAVP